MLETRYAPKKMKFAYTVPPMTIRFFRACLPKYGDMLEPTNYFELVAQPYKFLEFARELVAPNAPQETFDAKFDEETYMECVRAVSEAYKNFFLPANGEKIGEALKVVFAAVKETMQNQEEESEETAPPSGQDARSNSPPSPDSTLSTGLFGNSPTPQEPNSAPTGPEQPPC